MFLPNGHDEVRLWSIFSRHGEVRTSKAQGRSAASPQIVRTDRGEFKEALLPKNWSILLYLHLEAVQVPFSALRQFPPVSIAFLVRSEARDRLRMLLIPVRTIHLNLMSQRNEATGLPSLQPDDRLFRSGAGHFVHTVEGHRKPSFPPPRLWGKTDALTLGEASRSVYLSSSLSSFPAMILLVFFSLAPCPAPGAQKRHFEDGIGFSFVAGPENDLLKSRRINDLGPRRPLSRLRFAVAEREMTA